MAERSTSPDPKNAMSMQEDTLLTCGYSQAEIDNACEGLRHNEEEVTPDSIARCLTLSDIESIVDGNNILEDLYDGTSLEWVIQKQERIRHTCAEFGLDLRALVQELS